MRVRIASRASDLALWQANHVAELLRQADPAAEIVVETFSTRGDRENDPHLSEMGGQGVFTAEVDRVVLDGEADLAVHSLKDLPIETAKGLVLASIPARAPVEDALISRDGKRLRELPAGARVGTSSPRRAAFLRSVRPDLDVRNVRGNVPTRLGRVADGHLDATMLARAGLERLGLAERITELVGPPGLLPAPGQGAIGIVARAGDDAVIRRLVAIDDPDTHRAVDAERAVLAGLGGGCSLPFGSLCTREGRGWRLDSVLFLDGGRTRLDDSRRGDDPRALAAAAARALREKGAPA